MDRTATKTVCVIGSTQHMRNLALDAAIRASGYRKAFVAERLGVHPGTLTRWLAGDIPPRWHRDGLADLLGVPASELFPLSDAEEPAHAA